MDAAGPEKATAGHAHDDVDHKQQNGADQAVHPDGTPEHGPGQVAGCLAEGDGIISQVLRLVHQQLQPLAPVRNVLDVLHHNILQLVDLPVHLTDGIHIPRLAVVLHLRGQRSRKFRIHGIGNGRRHRKSVRLDKLFLDLGEKQECAGSLEAIVTDAHVDDPVFANVVNQIVPMGVRQLVVLQLNLRDDLLGNFGEIPHTFGVLGQHRWPTADHTVQDGHPGAGTFKNCRRYCCCS